MRLTSIFLIAGCILGSIGGIVLSPSSVSARQNQPWNFCLTKTIESTNRILTVKNPQGEQEQLQLPSSRQWFGVDLKITNISNDRRSARDIALGSTTLVARSGDNHPVSPEASPIVYTGAINKPVNPGSGETVRLYFDLPAGTNMKGISVSASGGGYYIDYDRNPCSN
jgi:hypothetical protein